ncbi:metallophosphoesterase family protein [Pseudogracilibacillus auburnensis]|uniref:metallophosphoesterase family protein n=1 Tax=Pseudogracilibacillus auburnensis TaxID=1494959 RepID=UPI001A95E4B1|nr:metallophosphoesterase [Pseudogracilibacillus auburnensis]MBO1002681.1 metallophosphoesterase [Pseudogracilibacillus auburnensis]
MNKVLILSDSHGLTEELTIIKERHHADYYIHCGDSELMKSTPPLNGFTTVKGNCDWKGDFPLEKIVEIGELRFFITHGHLFDVKMSLLHLQYRAQEVEADIVCFGHSHIAYAEKNGEQLFINPGSIRLPKRFKEPSYVLLKWTSAKDVNVTFYHVNGKEITHFPYENQFNLK